MSEDYMEEERIHQKEKKDHPILILYYKPSCPFCKKIFTLFQNIAKTILLKNIDQDLEAREELLSLGGKTQVPCLLINGKPLYESDAIIKWLKDKKYPLQ